MLRFMQYKKSVHLGSNDLLDAVPGFAAAIRNFMVGVLATTYQKIEVFVFLQFQRSSIDADVFNS
jgi:hypothetical protein